MILKQFQGLFWHEFELLADCPVIHGSFMRHGGHSSLDHLASLNLGRKVGDDLENVHQNFKKVAEALTLQDIVTGKLCHGASITAIPVSSHELPISDGLSINHPNFGLMITQADCQAAIFYDPIQHAIANVHCGWRGSVQNIYSSAIGHMSRTYGSKPENLLVCVSPSLGPINAEFINYQKELPESFWDYQVRPFYFDFWKITEFQLIQAGVLSHHIQIAEIDTYSNEDYFSYRRSNKCGRQGTVCALKEKR